MRFDWYQVTVYGPLPETVAETIRAQVDLADVVPGRAFNGYLHGLDVRRGEDTIATVWWGGNPGVHVKATGSNSPLVASIIQRLRNTQGWSVMPTRLDACEDWKHDQRLFDRLSAILLCFAVDNGIQINQQGDWERGEGRTLYLGSPKGPCRLVLYEKGFEVYGANPPELERAWVRLELRVRPHASRRAVVANWGPEDLLRASRWLSEAVEAIGYPKLAPLGVGRIWTPTDAEKARRAMLRQYAKTLVGWMHEVGSWADLGPAIYQAMEDLEQEQSHV